MPVPGSPQQISLEELLGRLDRFKGVTTQQCVEIMKEQVPVGPTGGLRDSIRVLERGSNNAVIGSDLYYAEIVETGRGPVVAKDKVLHFYGYSPGQHSIHKDDAGEEYFRLAVGPAEPNDYLGRTRDAILAADLDTSGFRWIRQVARLTARKIRRTVSDLWNKNRAR